MSDMLSSTLFLLLSSAPVIAGCGIPPWQLNQLVRYQSWYDYWMGGTFKTIPRQELKAVRIGDTWVIYLSQSRTIFSITPTRVSSAICGTQDSWIECVQTHLPTGPTDLHDAILGRSHNMIEVTEPMFSKCNASGQTMAPLWHPSPNSSAKSEEWLAIVREVRSVARNFGTIVEIRCNDFNRSDPQVWCQVTTDPGHDRNPLLLVGVDLSLDPAVAPLLTVIRPVSTGDAVMLDKIRAVGLVSTERVIGEKSR